MRHVIAFPCLLSLLCVGLATGAGEVRPAPSARGRIYVVSVTHPRATDDGPGTEATPFKTISAAAERAGPGDTVLVRAGVYRERVSPARGGKPGAPVVFAAAEGEKVVVKGSEEWSPDWKPVEGHRGVYFAELDTNLLEHGNPYHAAIVTGGSPRQLAARPTQEKAMPLTLGQVFVDGDPLEQVAELEQVHKQAGTWIVSGDGKGIYIHFPEPGKPAEHLVELSVRNRVFAPRRRGLGYIHVKGFIFEHCANQGPFPQGGAVSVRSGHHWVIGGNTICYAKTVGLDCGSEYWDGKRIPDTAPEDQRLMIGGHHLILGNTITDNGLCGIAGWNHQGTTIFGNVIARNNRLRITKGGSIGWEEYAGIKLHASDALIEANLVRDNEAHGIWLDNGYRNARPTRNLVINNRMSGIFIELGTGRCLIDNNIVAGTREKGSFYNGIGVYTHDASGVTVTHNLIMQNAGPGVVMRTVTNRGSRGEPVATSQQRIYNNILAGNGQPAVMLPYPSSRARDNRCDYNVFRRAGAPTLLGNVWSLGTPSGSALTKKLQAALQANGVSKAEWPGPSTWPAVALAHWRLLMGMDAHSVDSASAVTTKLDSGDLSLSLQAGPDLLQIGCPAVRGVDRDYFGKGMPTSGRLPGPFQALRQGSNRLSLWPVGGKPPTGPRARPREWGTVVQPQSK